MLFNIAISFCLLILIILSRHETMFKLNPNMKINKINKDITIIDNFYKYPFKIRNYALQQQYKDHNTLYKTKYFNPKMLSCRYEVANFIKHLEKIHGKTINRQIWDKNTNIESNGFFQYVTLFTKPVIHHDAKSSSGLVYLSPNPKSNTGTSFYVHKQTGIFKKQLNDVESSNKNEWKKYFTCFNKFNRALFFDGKLYHCSDGGFGISKSTARLYQTFFF